MHGLPAAVSASLVMAAVSTAGDYVWAAWIPEHKAVYGLAHGTLLFLAAGLLLGIIGAPHASAVRDAGAGASWGAVIGALGASAFYVLSPVMGFSAMFVVWFGVWLALAALYRRVSSGGIERRQHLVTHANFGAVASRGVAAAMASGLAFYLISGIWRPFNPQGWDYAVHFGAWTLAFLPGFAALVASYRT